MNAKNRSINMNPENDGIDHINVYSKGQTRLGRFLSNFADTPFDHPEYGRFRTVEGFWYWLMTGLEELRHLPGWECKELGKRAKIKRTQLEAYPRMKEMLQKNTLPLAHYYVYNGKVIEPKEWTWTALLWNKL